MGGLNVLTRVRVRECQVADVGLLCVRQLVVCWYDALMEGGRGGEGEGERERGKEGERERGGVRVRGSEGEGGDRGEGGQGVIVGGEEKVEGGEGGRVKRRLIGIM